MASQTHHSSSDVLPSNSNEITPAEENPASVDHPTPAEDDPASDDHHTPAEENPASDDHHTPAEENPASVDHPTPAEDDTALDDHHTPAEENPAVDDHRTPAEDNPPSDDHHTPAEDHQASHDKPSAADDDDPASDDHHTPAEDNLASDDHPTPAEGDPTSHKDHNHTPVEDHEASYDKPSVADEDDPDNPSEIQHSSSDVLPSSSNEITPAEDNLASLNKSTPAEDDHAPHDNHTPAEENPASDDKPPATNEVNHDSHYNPTPAEDDLASLGNPHKPERSVSEPMSKVSKIDNGVHSHGSKIQSLCNLIKEELKYMHDDPEKLKEYGTVVERQLEEATAELQQLEESLDEIPEGSPDHDEEIKNLHLELRELKKRVTKLKAKFPSKAKIHSLEKELKKADDSKADSHLTSILKEKKKLKLPSLYKNSTFEESGTFGDVQSLYNDLDRDEKKLCLLCFAVFPDDAKIKKRVMIYWWIAEGFITSEKGGHIFLEEFKVKGFIIPVPEKPGFEVHSYKVHPLARVVLISLAEKARFFDFNKDGYPTEKYSRSLRACLVGEGLSDVMQLEKMHMLFNVNESILEFKPEWFPKMQNINILYLGRWQSEEQHHIEIEDSEFLESLQHLKFLKFLSLQGVSRVIEIPDSIKKLGRLMILDLRACHNLEVIPAGIGSLKNLTYLDMSDCYLIDHMPKELSLLENLLVLKGFVVGDPKENKEKKSCTLKDLAKLKKLKKLSIYTGVLDFPSNKDLEALGVFTGLESLTIAWGSASSDKSDATVKEGKGATQKLDNNAQQRKVIADRADLKTLERKGTKVKFAASPPKTSDAPDTSVASKKEAKDTGKPVVTENKNQESERNEEVQEERKASSAIAATERGKQVETSRSVKNGNLDESRDTKEKTPRAFKRSISKFPFHLGDQRSTSNDANPPSLPGNLRKLDLKCYPKLFSPHWLKPNRLKKLRKLYIRGGKLRDLGEVYEWIDDKPRLATNRWDEVEILRLKFLEEMEIRWKELSHLFPKLMYLEKVNCPKLTLFPCDSTGVWIDKTKIQSNQEKPSVSP